jgi:hypothetical protein
VEYGWERNRGINYQLINSRAITLMAGLFLAIFRLLMLPRLSSLYSNLERTSDPRINWKGVKGSPCLKPLSTEKRPNELPLMSKEKEEEEI